MISFYKISFYSLFFLVLMTFGIGLFASDLRTSRGRQAFKSQVASNIKNKKWIEAAKGIEQFDKAGHPRFAIELRKIFVQSYSTPSSLPYDKELLKNIRGRQQAKRAVVNALNNRDFSDALAGIQALPEVFQRDLHKKFVEVVVTLHKDQQLKEKIETETTVELEEEIKEGDEEWGDDEDEEVISSADDDGDEYIDEGEDENPDELFIAAAEKNNLEVMKKLFEQKGASINSLNKHGVSALMFAVSNEDAEVVKFLLDNGADPDLPNSAGVTVLIFASENGYENIVKLLLDKKANPDIQDKKGATALMWAAFKGYQPIVTLLLEKDAKIDLKDITRSTARDYAQSGGHTAIVSMLSEKLKEQEKGEQEDIKQSVVAKNIYALVSAKKIDARFAEIILNIFNIVKEKGSWSYMNSGTHDPVIIHEGKALVTQDSLGLNPFRKTIDLSKAIDISEQFMQLLNLKNDAVTLDTVMIVRDALTGSGEDDFIRFINAAPDLKKGQRPILLENLDKFKTVHTDL